MAGHLEIFDEVIASDGGENVKRPHQGRYFDLRLLVKRVLLCRKQPRRLAGLASRGNSAVIVTPRGMLPAPRAASAKWKRQIDERPSRFAGILRAMRRTNGSKLFRVFCSDHYRSCVEKMYFWGWAHDPFCISGFLRHGFRHLPGEYLSDLSADRRHPRKRNRPFASGAVPLHFGVIIAIWLLGIGLELAILGKILFIVLTYAVMSIAYSAKLKEMPLVDVFMLAALSLSGSSAAASPPVTPCPSGC